MNKEVRVEHLVARVKEDAIKQTLANVMKGVASGIKEAEKELSGKEVVELLGEVMENIEGATNEAVKDVPQVPNFDVSKYALIVDIK